MATSGTKQNMPVGASGRRLLVSLAAPLLAVAACELLLRLTLPRDRLLGEVWATYRPDPVLRRVHVPGSAGHYRPELREDGSEVRFRYDQHGMRGTNDFLDEPPDPTRPRVMLLGDSFIEQRQLADGDLIQTQLEQMPSQRMPSMPHVFGYGVSGWSPIEYTLYYKTQARGFRPNMLFVFLTFNDYHDDSQHAAECRFGSTGELLACPPPGADSIATTNRAGPSFSMLVDLYRDLKVRRRLAAESDTLREQMRSGTRAPGSEDLLAILDASRIGSTLPIVRRTFGFLRELFDLARKDGASPVLVIIPWPHQVGAEESALGRVPLGIPVNRREPSTVYQDVTVQVAREAGIDTIDLLPALHRQAAREHMFFSFNGHFTPAAARVVASVLADAVVKMSERPDQEAVR